MGISPKQFAELQQRVGGKRRPSPSIAEPSPKPVSTPPPEAMILGLDPSLRGTGWAVIRGGRQPSAVAYGTIRNPASWERSRCLMKIAVTLRDLLKEHPATVCAIEGLFFAQNLQTALIMGEARGAALASIAEAGLEIYEMAPRRVKQAIVGYGGAQKLAVAKMVQRMLNLSELPDADAADALALALTYAQESGRHALNPPKKI